MPERKTLERAARDKRQGSRHPRKAGEFIREEIEHVRAGKHGVRSTGRQWPSAVARRARRQVPAPKHASAAVKRKANRT